MGPIPITSPHTETHGPFFQIRPHSLGLGVSTSTLTFINFFFWGGNTIHPEHPAPGCRGLRGRRRGKRDPEEEERASETRTPRGLARTAAPLSLIPPLGSASAWRTAVALPFAERHDRAFRRRVPDLEPPLPPSPARGRRGWSSCSGRTHSCGVDSSQADPGSEPQCRRVKSARTCRMSAGISPEATATSASPCESADGPHVCRRQASISKSGGWWH